MTLEAEDRIDLPLQHRAATFAPASWRDEDRSIEVVWTTGAVVRRWDWWTGEDYDEELVVDDKAVDLSRLNASAPFLRVHNLYSLDAILGVVEPGSARIENGQGLARVRLSERPDLAGTVADIRAGIIRQVSVGYSIDEVVIEQRKDEVPLHKAVRWTPLEISAVPIGADSGAQTRNRGAAAADGQRVFPCRRRGESSPTTRSAAMEGDDATAAKATKTEAPAPAPAAPAPAAPARDEAAIRAEERARIDGIRTAARLLAIDAKLADDLIARGVAIEAARSDLFRIAAERDQAQGGSGSAVSVPLGGLDERTTRRNAVAGALLHRHNAGLFPLSDPARQYRGMTLMEIAKDLLTANNESWRGLPMADVAQRALSTGDFPAILADVANQTLRKAYAYQGRSFTPFCRKVTASNFKPIKRVQLSGVPQLEPVNEDGEFKTGALAESKQGYQLTSLGKIVSMTRQLIINDDLDAFTRIPWMFGVAGAKTENNIVWGLLTSNIKLGDDRPLFHAAHKNLGKIRFGLEGLDEGLVTMASQTVPGDDTPMEQDAKFLLVPKAMQTRAQQLVRSVTTPAKTEDVVPESMKALTVIAEIRLDRVSKTAFYLAADPNQVDTIEYAYLEGQEGVYIESREGFEVDGVQIKCRLDFGAGLIDHIGLYRSDGTQAPPAPPAAPPPA